MCCTLLVGNTGRKNDAIESVVCHDLCNWKTAEPIEMPFGVWTPVGPMKHVLDGGAHWCNLENMIEPSMCGGTLPFHGRPVQ